MGTASGERAEQLLNGKSPLRGTAIDSPLAAQAPVDSKDAKRGKRKDSRKSSRR